VAALAAAASFTIGYRRVSLYYHPPSTAVLTRAQAHLLDRRVRPLATPALLPSMIALVASQSIQHAARGP
jgi:hypothetical protein